MIELLESPCYELSVLTPQERKWGGLPAPHTFIAGDFGLYMEHAVRLAQDGHRVLYFTPWADKFPTFRDYAVGMGMEGLQKPLDFWEELDKLDPADVTVYFPDVGWGGQAVHLRKQGYAVFGAGRGDRLENYRQLLKERCEQAGIRVPPWKPVHGLAALRECIKATATPEAPKYVKLDIFRGDMESFPAKNLKSVELLLDRIEAAWGPAAEDKDFIVEEVVGTEEVGHDGVFVGSDWLRPYLWGTEIHKNAYAGRVSNRVPPVIAETVNKLQAVLAPFDYRAWCSTEIRADAQGQTWFIDLCARAPSPLSIGYTELFDNFSEVIYSVARNRPVVPVYRGRYLVVVALESRAAEKNWVYLDFPQELRKNIKLRLGARFKGSYYTVPGLPTCFVLVGVGDDLEAVGRQVLDLVPKLDAWDLITGATGGVDEAVEQLRRLEAQMPGGSE